MPAHHSPDDEPAAAAVEDFFDPSFLEELAELADVGVPDRTPAVSEALRRRLDTFLAPLDATATGPLSEAEFAALAAGPLTERVNTLIDLCRESSRPEAAQAVESFVVFFRTLLPTLDEHAGREMRRLFFRLVPTLLHVAFQDFGQADARRHEGPTALRSLERVLIEISSVRLGPSEAELVFRSIDQMAGFISVGEFHMASDVICAQLMGIIERNKLTRTLYRLMEVEVAVQRYLHERLGYTTPRLTLPDDASALAEYGPVRIMHEADAGAALEPQPAGESRFIQVHLPGIEMPADVVLHLASRDGRTSHDLRLDALGSAVLHVPDGAYDIGLVYDPGGS